MYPERPCTPAQVFSPVVSGQTSVKPATDIELSGFSIITSESFKIQFHQSANRGCKDITDVSSLHYTEKNNCYINE